MGKFEFDGEWHDSTIMLEIFAKELDNPKYAFRRSELADAEYLLQIFDVYDDNPDLSKGQYNAIEHLQRDLSQSEILITIFNYFQSVIYPEYQEIISEEEYPGTFPPLNNISDLKEVIGLDHINLLNIGYNDFNYYNLMFETSLDQECGIGIGLYKSEITGHGSIPGLGFGKISKHMGLNDIEFEKLKSKLRTNPSYENQIASNKYGKLKPWQKDVNEKFHYKLVREGRDRELFNFIDSGQISLDKAYEDLKPLMTINNRTELIEYFRKKGYK